MVDSSHCCIEPSHYDEGAKEYDILNEENSQTINHVLDEVLKRYDVETVLDLTCGTGLQIFWLVKRIQSNWLRHQYGHAKHCQGQSKKREAGYIDLEFLDILLAKNKSIEYAFCTSKV